MMRLTTTDVGTNEFYKDKKEIDSRHFENVSESEIDTFHCNVCEISCVCNNNTKYNKM